MRSWGTHDCEYEERKGEDVVVRKRGDLLSHLGDVARPDLFSWG